MFRRRLPLPAPRRLPWTLKPLSSAETSLQYDAFGRMVMHIRHDLIRGVTPEMLAWWFAHIGGDMEIDGKTLNKYLVWHPFDHIHWELVRPAADGRAGAGAVFRIVEAFGADPNMTIDIEDTVTRLDSAGITLQQRKLGHEVSRLNHDFHATEGGTRYISTLTIGFSAPVLRALNPAVFRFLFSETMGRAWLKHNVEEVGALEHILPRIYPRGTGTPAYAVSGEAG
jgi:hypothetical protein